MDMDAAVVSSTNDALPRRPVKKREQVKNERAAFFRHVFENPEWTYDTLPIELRHMDRRQVQRLWHERPKSMPVYATCVDDVIRACLEAEPPTFRGRKEEKCSDE